MNLFFKKIEISIHRIRLSSVGFSTASLLSSFPWFFFLGGAFQLPACTIQYVGADDPLMIHTRAGSQSTDSENFLDPDLLEHNARTQGLVRWEEEMWNYLDQHFIGPLSSSIGESLFFFSYSIQETCEERVCSFDGNVTRMETHWPLEIKLGDSRYRRATISCYFRVYSTIIVSFFFVYTHTHR